MYQDNIEIIRKNLEELSRRDHIGAEQRHILISELASLLINSEDGRHNGEIYSNFRTALGEVCSLSDKLELCRHLCRHLKSTDIHMISPLAESFVSVAAGSHEKIAVVRNNYNNMALERFSEVIPRAKGVYFPTFEECCEAVAEEKCEFAIVPIEDNADGRMFGFYSLLDRFGLSIQAVCSVETETKTVKYALAGRNPFCRELEKSLSDKTRFFEFSIIDDPPNLIPDLFLAASLCKARIRKTASISISYNDMTRFFFSFEIGRSTEVTTLLTYLWLEYPEYSPIGIYREI